MEFNNMRIAGHQVMAIFNGPRYLFYSSFFGLVAYAERRPDSDGVKRFKFYMGNHHCLGGSLTPTVIFKACAKYIRKSENRYIPVDVELEHLAGPDLALVHIGLDLTFNGTKL